MVRLLVLKRMENLSDKALILQWQ
ncbi:hypothetical protein ABO04_10365 [Nitrosomonas sp. HPC101]|nr:hypothetical protein [Nitrosomonas sp. HPC101]